jgi:hypothetical protein
MSKSCEKHLEMPFRPWFEFHPKFWRSKERSDRSAMCSSLAYKDAPNNGISPNGRVWSRHRLPIRYSKIERPENHCAVVLRHRTRKVLSRAPAPSEAKDGFPRIRQRLGVRILLRKETVWIIAFWVVPNSWVPENIPVWGRG